MMARPNSAPSRIEKKCEFCGKGFSVPPSRKDSARFCSLQCLAKWKSEQNTVELRCPVCGRLFWLQKNTANKQKCCSHKCADSLRAKRVTKRCLVCGKEFEVPWSRRNRAKFCSRPCFDTTKIKVRHKPTKVQLEHLLNVMTLMEVAKMYEVTDNAVRYWCGCVGVTVPDHKERNRIKAENKKIKLGASHRGPRK